MVIDEIVAYCHSRYNRSGRCPGCQNDCQNGCEACLDAIHFMRIARSYNCENISNFYVCKYIYKYSAEIDHLIARLNFLNGLDTYDILSLGCGPCTELVGILSSLSRTQQNRPLSFVGIDSNLIWQPIHSKLIEATAGSGCQASVRFMYGDALQVIRSLNLQNTGWRPNILILQYFISNLVMSGANVLSFTKELSGSVVPFMPIGSYIVLNDINHYSARFYSDILEKTVTSSCPTWVYRAHFRNNNRQAYQYGEEHKTNLLTSKVPEQIRNRYHPWEFCTSAQMVINKKA